MAPVPRSWFKSFVCARFVIALLAVFTVLTGTLAAQEEVSGPSQVGEGSLLFRSPVSGKYEQVPLLHTDVTIDVRGLVASATVMQQYANASNMPIEAIYVSGQSHEKWRAGRGA